MQWIIPEKPENPNPEPPVDTPTEKPGETPGQGNGSGTNGTVTTGDRNNVWPIVAVNGIAMMVGGFLFMLKKKH